MNSKNYGNGSYNPGGSGDAEETSVFGAQSEGTSPQSSYDRPSQVFPDSQGYQQDYGQPQDFGQPQYEQQPPRAYAAPEPSKGGKAAVIILAALLAVAVVAAGIFALLFVSTANRPDPEPVTTTMTTTTMETTTVSPTKEPKLPRFGRNDDSDGDDVIPTEIPTELPPEVEDQINDLGKKLENGADDLEGFIDSLSNG